MDLNDVINRIDEHHAENKERFRELSNMLVQHAKDEKEEREGIQKQINDLGIWRWLTAGGLGVIVFLVGIGALHLFN